MPITPGSSTTVAYASRTNTTVTTPAGAVTGQSVIAVSLTAGLGSLTAVTITPPGSGWEEIGNVTYTASDPWAVRVITYIRVYDGSASYTFTHAASSTQAFCRVWEGVDTTTMQDCPPTTAAYTLNQGLTATAPALTIVTAGAMGIINRGSWDGTAITAPAGWTESYDQPVMWIGLREYTSTGSTGTVAVPAGNSSSSSPWGIIHGALRPAAVITGPAFDAASFDAGAFYTSDGGSVPSGTATGTLAFSGSAVGQRTPKATAGGTLAFTGTATGKRTPKATATGALAFAGSAVGDAPPSRGTAAGSLAFTGTATGKRTPKASASGTVTFTGSATGTTVRRGTAGGTLTFTGSAVGKRTPKGSTNGTLAFVGTATGKRAPKGSGSGTLAFTGSAIGNAPTAGLSEGSAVGSLTFTGTAVGKRSPKGGATGGLAFAGAAVGKRQPKGSSVGTLALAGAAVGKHQPVATAAGSLAWVGAAVGRQPGPPTEFEGRIISARLVIPAATGSIAVPSASGDLVTHGASGRLSILRARGVIE